MPTMKFKVQIDNDRVYEFDLEKELEIKEEKLDAHLKRQPSKFAWFATMAGLAKAKAERAEYRLEEFENELYLRIREKKEKKKKEGEEGPRLTEETIKAMIRTNEKRIALVNRMINAKEQVEISMAAKEAFAQRKDCLISMGANRRAQYDSELSVKSRK